MLYDLVDIGEVVTIINEPYQFGRRDGQLFFEAHAPLEDDPVLPEERLKALLDAQVDASGAPLNEHLRDHAKVVAADPRGLPIGIFQLDESEYLARARVVRNTVETDPDAPTLGEVREMMEEVEAEMAAENEEL